MHKKNEGFTCVGCFAQVDPAQQTSRNHCPFCFLCLHVDRDLPGDRLSECGGRMVPIEYEIANGETRLRFECLSCKKEHWNKTASDDHLDLLEDALKHWKLKRETNHTSN